MGHCIFLSIRFYPLLSLSPLFLVLPLALFLFHFVTLSYKAIHGGLSDKSFIFVIHVIGIVVRHLARGRLQTFWICHA